MLTSLESNITFAVASYGGAAVLRSNFLASPCFSMPHNHQIIIKQDLSSAAVAYNNAIDEAVNDLIVFAHYDIVFPVSWISQLALALKHLDRVDPSWGVLGCYGMTTDSPLGFGRIYQHGMGLIGQALEGPTPVQTLDEIVLIIRKSSGLRFDERLPHFHFYGADICLRAARMKMRSYAIPAFCVHNTNHYLVLPKDFYTCYAHFRRTWKDALPVQTSCIRATRSNVDYYRRRLQEARLKWISRRTFLQARTEDVAQLIAAAERAMAQTVGDCAVQS
jgi:hypothetical protein